MACVRKNCFEELDKYLFCAIKHKSKKKLRNQLNKYGFCNQTTRIDNTEFQD